MLALLTCILYLVAGSVRYREEFQMKVIIGGCVGGGLFFIILMCVIVVVIYKKKSTTTYHVQNVLQLQPWSNHHEQQQNHPRIQHTDENGDLDDNMAPTIRMPPDPAVSCGEYLHPSPTEGIQIDNIYANEDYLNADMAPKGEIPIDRIVPSEEYLRMSPTEGIPIDTVDSNEDHLNTSMTPKSELPINRVVSCGYTFIQREFLSIT